MEEARRPPERHARDEPRHGQHPALPEQRPELQGRRQERDQVQPGQRPLEDQPAQPVVGCGEPVHGRLLLAILSRPNRLVSWTPSPCHGLRAGGTPRPGDGDATTRERRSVSSPAALGPAFHPLHGDLVTVLACTRTPAGLVRPADRLRRDAVTDRARELDVARQSRPHSPVRARSPGLGVSPDRCRTSSRARPGRAGGHPRHQPPLPRGPGRAARPSRRYRRRRPSSTTVASRGSAAPRQPLDAAGGDAPSGAVVGGQPWPGYRAARVVAVAASERFITYITIIDLVDNTWIERLIDYDSRHDHVVPPPQPVPPTPMSAPATPLGQRSDETASPETSPSAGSDCATPAGTPGVVATEEPYDENCPMATPPPTTVPDLPAVPPDGNRTTVPGTRTPRPESAPRPSRTPPISPTAAG